LHKEIAIRDFSIGSGPSIGRGVAWHEILASRSILGVFEGKEIVQQEIAIRDFPTRSEPSVHTGQVSGIRRKSHIGKSESLRTRNSGHRKSRNPDEWGPAVVTSEKEDRGLVEASCQPTGVRDIGVFEDMERSQQEIAIRDFPTGSTPSISEDAWREIPESRSSAYRSFQSRETLTQ
jgi:hypothetical protein